MEDGFTLRFNRACYGSLLKDRLGDIILDLKAAKEFDPDRFKLEIFNVDKDLDWIKDTKEFQDLIDA